MMSEVVMVYDGIPIEKGLYGDVYSVQYCGDDYLFDDLDDAILLCGAIEVERMMALNNEI